MVHQIIIVINFLLKVFRLKNIEIVPYIVSALDGSGVNEIFEYLA